MTRRLLPPLVLLAAVLLATACELPTPEPRVPMTRYAFIDMTRSISPAEREAWVQHILEAARPLGQGLQHNAEYDELVIFLLHASSATAAPYASLRFPGGAYQDALRRRAYAALRDTLTALAHLELPRAVLQWTDVLGAVARIQPQAHPIHLAFYSDMLHSTPSFDMERRTFTEDEAAVLAEPYVMPTLAQATVAIHLPATLTGAKSKTPPPVRAFWNAVFEASGTQTTWSR